MTTLLSVDPGKRGCGCAVWRDGVLIAADYVAGKSPKSLDGPRLHAETAVAVVEWAVRMLVVVPQVGNVFSNIQIIHTLAVEFPQTYGGRSSKGDTRDLLGLAGVDGALAALLPSSMVEWRVPHDWKGGIQKPKSAEEVYPIQTKVIGRLSSEENAQVTWPGNKRHQWDVADGIGVGLSLLGRFERRRVYAVE